MNPEQPVVPPPAPDMWTLKKAALVFLVVIGYQLAVGLLLLLAGQIAGQAWEREWLLPLFVLLLPGAMAAALWARRRREGIKPIWDWRELSDRRGWGLVGLCLLLNLTVSVAYALATEGAVEPELNREVVGLLAGSSDLPWGQLAALFTGMVFLAPLSEEWLFRGVLQGMLHDRWGPWVALPVSALVFGGFHGLSQWLVTGVFGLGFGWVAYRRNSLTFSMIAHGAWNLLAFAQMVALGRDP